MAQFKECILVAVTHPLELKFRTSTKELKARSRVGKQAHPQSSPHGPHSIAVLRWVPFWRPHHTDQQEFPRVSHLALELGPVLLLPASRPAVHRLFILFFVRRMIISFCQRETRALSQGRIIHVATVEAERRLDLNPEGFPL